MAIIDLPRVNPGDLITSDLMNRLVLELVALEARVEDLENAEPTPAPTGRPVLTRRQPEGDVRMGGLLTLFGRNFAPLSATTVMLGGQSISEFAVGSGDTRLSFQVPQFADERRVSVTVSNAQGTSTPLTNIQLRKPAGAPLGEVVVEDLTEELEEIVVGETYDLAWRVRSTDRNPTPYTFEIALSEVFPVNTRDAWSDGIELGSTGDDISSGNPAAVKAKVKVPASRSATLTLRVTGPAGAISSATPITLAVGEVPDVSDPSVQVKLKDQQPFDDFGNPNPVHRVDDAIEVELGSAGKIDVDVALARAQARGARLAFAAELEDDSGGLWETGKVDPEQGDLEPGAETTIRVPIANNGTGARQPDQTFLKVSATKQGADGFVSFTRIVIRSGDGS
jgi:hypothetical protein